MATKYFPAVAQRLKAMQIESRIERVRFLRDQKFEHKFHTEFNGHYLRNETQRRKLNDRVEKLKRFRHNLLSELKTTEDHNADPAAKLELDDLRQSSLPAALPARVEDIAGHAMDWSPKLLPREKE
mmetsp:Transcript_82025/g.144879  ORF Transcript_82025/g.144879 Transcript_82025/m.144879 type:complete len:126 (-) Transcript_82025:332-709(-)